MLASRRSKSQFQSLHQVIENLGLNSNKDRDGDGNNCVGLNLSWPTHQQDDLKHLFMCSVPWCAKLSLTMRPARHGFESTCEPSEIVYRATSKLLQQLLDQQGIIY